MNANLCPCFAGTCRGGEVVNGRTACGQRCKACVPVLTERADLPDDMSGVEVIEHGTGSYDLPHYNNEGAP